LRRRRRRPPGRAALRGVRPVVRAGRDRLPGLRLRRARLGRGLRRGDPGDLDRRAPPRPRRAPGAPGAGRAGRGALAAHPARRRRPARPARGAAPARGLRPPGRGRVVRSVPPLDRTSFGPLGSRVMNTEVCARFGIEFPLFAFSHCRDVVAAVTNAGGFGVLGAVAYTPERLEEELRWIDDHVNGRPYGVDVLVPGKIDKAAESGGGPAAMLAAIPDEHWNFLIGLFEKYDVPLPDFEKAKRANARGVGEQVTAKGATELIDVALAHPIGLIASALGTPPPIMVEKAKAAGIPVAALVGTSEHARRQVAAGVDLIVAQGGEAGGHTGEISTMVLVPEVVDTVAP